MNQNNDHYSGLMSILAWAITIGIILLIIKTKIGYTLVFFFVISSLILVFLIGSPTIAKIFNSAGPTPPLPPAVPGG